ncbi:saccharopine dehydrogenase family protein [Ilumatobacter sp.]|uniref:saccharopine dehydrogenase family protein n=1 Tax=Ilumatobacter sp. TaxID=1967498 RepID=UPI003B51DCAF
MARRTPAHDIVLFGATSFVGQILCRRLVERHGTDGELSWAIAGRDAVKLDRVATETGADVERIVADAADPAALAAMCADARLVVSTVGPYALHGSELVAAVVEAGIDYCDLTGEPQWMQRMIDRHHERAVETGARVVHACGFDSVPSDLGVRFLQQAAVERFGSPCTDVRMGVVSARGGASGGTIASMMNIVSEVADDPGLRRVLTNPYALAPAGEREGVDQPSLAVPALDRGLGSWTAPFVMAATNTRVVLRSHALEGYPWGRSFTYGESIMTGSGPIGGAKALAVTGAMGAAMGAAAGAAMLGPLRSVVERVLPSAGDGPSPSTQEAGSYDLRFHGTTAAGEGIDARVTGDRDPGYGSTSKILAVAATSLLDSDVGGGFWTPATALGDGFVDELVERAGLTFDIVDRVD